MAEENIPINSLDHRTRADGSLLCLSDLISQLQIAIKCCERRKNSANQMRSFGEINWFVFWNASSSQGKMKNNYCPSVIQQRAGDSERTTMNHN